MSESNADASEGVQRKILSAHDDPADPEEVTRRTFMANATITIGGIVGVVLAVPIVGSLLPAEELVGRQLVAADQHEVDALQKATSKPVKLTFTLKYTDGVSARAAAAEYCWGIKVDPAKFQAARPDIYNQPGGKADVPYDVVNMGFVIFSPICPHLGCCYNWSDAQNRFMCPCHGSQYTFDGTHIAGPAPRGLDPLPLREQSGAAEVTWIRVPVEHARSASSSRIRHKVSASMLNWIEKRTGFVSMTKEFLTEDVPGGASYWYVFGSATLFAMIVQIVTGIFLTFFYAPSAATAWESTRAIYLNPYTHFLLAVHYWGASAMIALVFLHLLQVLIWGAYKSPRELQWVVGVLLLLVTLVLGLTGYLLPWDMDAYFASQVSLNIAGLAPIAGPFMQHIAQGGGTMGTATINRFFGLHVWLMPAALVALVGAHLAIFRHNGSAGPVVDDPRTLKPGRFWPDQMFMDGAFSFIVFVIICFLAFASPAVSRREGRSDEVLRAVSGVVFLVAVRPARARAARDSSRSAHDQHGTDRDDHRPDALPARRPAASVARSQHDPQLRRARAGCCGQRRSWSSRSSS